MDMHHQPPDTMPTEPATPAPESPDDPANWGQFEQILGSVAGRLANYDDESFDEMLTECLRDLAQHLGFDRCWLMDISESGCCFRVTHSWSTDNAPPSPLDQVVEDELPWYTQQIRSGYIVCVSGTADLPESADKERAFILARGIKLNVTVPLLVEGVITGAAGFNCFNREISCTPALVARLRLVGEVLSLGIRRFQYAQGLKTIRHTAEQLSGHRGQSAGQVAQLRCIAAKLMQSEHQERLRMGHFLQEDVMQSLAGTSMLLQSVDMDRPGNPAEVISRSVATLAETLAKLRRLVLQLRPEILNHKGVGQGIQWLASQMRIAEGLEVDFSMEERVEPVSHQTATFLYDATRKILESVAAQSRNAHVALEMRRIDSNWIRLTLMTDELRLQAFAEHNTTSGTFGLLSIREQADLLGGSLEVDFSPGKPAQVVITVRA